MNQGEVFEEIKIVERMNGGGRAGENERAEELCEREGYLGTGASDAHLASHVCTCMTKFEFEIGTEYDLVEALEFGEFVPVRLEDTQII